MKIRFATMPTIDRFIEGGLNLNPRWSEVELDDLTAEGRDVLEAAIGGIVQIHPDDTDKFVGTTDGLQLEGGRLALPTGTDKDDDGKVDPTVPKVGERHKASERGRPARRSATPTQAGTPGSPGSVRAPAAAHAGDEAKPVNPQPVTGVPEHPVGDHPVKGRKS